MDKFDYFLKLTPEEREGLRRRRAEGTNKVMAFLILVLFAAIWVIVIGADLESEIAIGVVAGTMPLATIIIQYYWRKRGS